MRFVCIYILFVIDVAAVKASAKTITGTVAPGTMSLYDFVADHTQVGGVTHGKLIKKSSIIVYNEYPPSPLLSSKTNV